MNKIFMPSSVGALLLAIIMSFSTFTLENIWVPITGILLALSLTIFSFKLTINSLEKRINHLEDELKK